MSIPVYRWADVEELRKVADASSPKTSYHLDENEYNFLYFVLLETRLLEAQDHYSGDDFQELQGRVDSDWQTSPDQV